MFRHCQEISLVLFLGAAEYGKSGHRANPWWTVEREKENKDSKERCSDRVIED